MKKFLIPTVLLALAIVFTTGVTLVRAEWRGTDWISSGSSISSEKIKDNFEYLYSNGGGTSSIQLEEGLRVGNITAPCTAELAGAIRWTGSVLQICDNNEWVTLYSPDQHCRAVQDSQNCTIPYSCGCSKYGCGTCTTTGKQYRVNFICPDSNVTTEWSTCAAN